LEQLTDAPTLIILAAGMGSRYGGLKQIVPVNQAGETIVDYSVYDAVRAGFGKVVFVIRKEIEQAFKEVVGAKYDDRIEVAYAFQELDDLPLGFTVPIGRTKPWGTLQATLVGAELTREPFGVINADDFYGQGSFRMLAQQLRHAPLNCSMIGFPLRKTLSDFGPVSRGICTVNDDGLLVSTVEMTKIVRDGTGARSIGGDGPEIKLSGDEIVSMNMWGFTSSVVEQLQRYFFDFLTAHRSDLTAESYLPEAVNRMVSEGLAKVEVLSAEDAWCGVTYPEDHAHVVETIHGLTLQGKYPGRLW
jgi:dTDP-glucose pyrophosphorylase